MDSPPHDILSTVTDQISVLHNVQWAVSQLSFTQQKHGRLEPILERILSGLLVVQDLCQNRPECVVERDALRATLANFQKNLLRLKKKCEAAVATSKRGSFQKAVSAKWFGDQHKELYTLMQHLERDIAPIYARYQDLAPHLRSRGLSGIRADFVNGAQKIRLRFETHVQHATSKPERVKTFVKTKRMSLEEKSKAKESTTQLLLGRRLSQVERQYCAVKVDLLSAEMNDSSPSSSSSDLGGRDKKAGPSRGQKDSDAVIETFQVLRSLELIRADEPLFSIASQLDRLQTLLAELKLIDDSVYALELLTILHRDVAIEAGPERPSPGLATTLHKLGDRLMETERSEDALQHYLESLAIRRHLTVIDPMEYGLDVAETLRSISQWYAADGKYQEALNKAEEVIKVIKLIAGADPEATRLHLGQAAHDLSKRLAAVGRRDEAMKCIEMAIEIRRKEYADAILEEEAVTAYNLASSLSGLSSRLSDFGRWEEALNVIEEASVINNKLVDQYPGNDTYQNELAATLMTLSTCLAVVGRHGEAVQQIEKVVAMQREFAADYPVLGRTQLAVALQHHGRRLEEIGEHYGAIASIQEAIQIWRDVTKSREPSSLCWTELASCLGDLSTCLRTTGQLEPATKYAFEAVSIRKRLAKDNEEAFLSSLATSFDQLSCCLLELGQMETAIKYGRAAVSVLVKLHGERRQSVFLSDLALFRSNLSLCLEKAHQYDAALVPIREAVESLRELVRDSDAFLPELAKALEDLASRSMLAGRRQAGFRSIHEATSIYRRLNQIKPESFKPSLGATLRVIASWYVEDGRLSEAIIQIRESVDIFKSLSEIRPETYLVEVVVSTNTLTRYFIETKRNAEALQSMKDSVDAQRQLASRRADEYQPDLAVSLRNLAGFLTKVGEHASAIRAAEESVEVYRALLSRRPGIEKHKIGLQESLKRVGVCCAAMEMDYSGGGPSGLAMVRRMSIKAS